MSTMHPFQHGSPCTTLGICCCQHGEAIHQPHICGPTIVQNNWHLVKKLTISFVLIQMCPGSLLHIFACGQFWHPMLLDVCQQTFYGTLCCKWAFSSERVQPAQLCSPARFSHGFTTTLQVLLHFLFCSNTSETSCEKSWKNMAELCDSCFSFDSFTLVLCLPRCFGQQRSYPTSIAAMCG